MAFRENVALNYSAKEMQKMFEAKCPRGRKTRTPRARKKAVGMQWASLAPVTKDQEDSEEEEEAFAAAADTYTNYTPAKMKIGHTHPDPVVESSSLSSVEPPQVCFQLKLPPSVVNERKLSSLQLESIVYACQQHEKILPDGTRAGFLVGDGAGVGKGRTIAGMIYQNYLEGRKKAIWLSVSNDLRSDAIRDLEDIGAKIPVYLLKEFQYGNLKSQRTGLDKEGVIFSTYASLIAESTVRGKNRSRFDQLVHWLGKDFEGIIVFDECHKAKNLVPSGSSKSTKTGVKVLELQQKLPKARILYCSATGASEPKNMAYMSRLGIWGEGTPFREFKDFIKAVEGRGVGAMEMVAMDMKLRGMYIARQLSFQGVQFSIHKAKLAPEFVHAYNASVQLWIEAQRLFQKAANLLDLEKKEKKKFWAMFWASHQRYFKYMCIAAKVSETISLTKQCLEEGKCVVIGLQSTGEARTMDQLEQEGGALNDFVSTIKAVFEKLVNDHFPGEATTPVVDQPYNESKEELEELKVGNKRRKGSTASTRVRSKRVKTDSASSVTSDGISMESESSSNGVMIESEIDLTSCLPEVGITPPSTLENSASIVEAMSKTFKGDNKKKMKEFLLTQLELLAPYLPTNTLDQLINGLGGPQEVAEMTGRRGRVLRQVDGSVQYHLRSEDDVGLELLNITEKQRFMDGHKNIAIISEAASSGISLQADRRAGNKKRRVHITLELPWSADRAIQQFGRTHRSNQVSAPEYIFIISDLAGEQRFASIVAKRLVSLGALTHGDRRATTESRDLSKYNVDTKYGREALEITLKSMVGRAPQLVTSEEYSEEFFEECQKELSGVGLICRDKLMVDKDSLQISRFLNRILGLSVYLQNTLFAYFSDTLAAVIKNAKKLGKYDLGIVDFGAGGENVEIVETKEFVRNGSVETATTKLHKIKVERGMSYSEALDKLNTDPLPGDGFYISHKACGNGRAAVLLKAVNSRGTEFTVFRPNTGQSLDTDTRGTVLNKYQKASSLEQAKKYWNAQYEFSVNNCIHAFWSRNGLCKRLIMSGVCDVGLRQRTMYVVCGSILGIWACVESVFQHHKTRMQIVRVRSEDKRLVGIQVRELMEKDMTRMLNLECSVAIPTSQPPAISNPSILQPSAGNSITLPETGPEAENVTVDDFPEALVGTAESPIDVDGPFCVSSFNHAEQNCHNPTPP